jgi:hypothetical protein
MLESPFDHGDFLHEADSQKLNIIGTRKGFYVAETSGLPTEFDRTVLSPDGLAITHKPRIMVLKQTSLLITNSLVIFIS